VTTFGQLVDRARALVSGGGRAVLGIAGAPGSGKTTLAEALVRALAGLPAAHVPMDGFHLADIELDRLGRRDRKGAPDTFDPAGYAALLARLHTDDAPIVYAPGFERVLEQPIAGAIPVSRDVRLVVTEGNYLLLTDPPWDRVRAQLTEVWYAEVDDEERLGRLVDRHVRFGKPPALAREWASGTDERNAALVRATRRDADLVVPALVIPI
jgi:pantothenate kinase